MSVVRPEGPEAIGTLDSLKKPVYWHFRFEGEPDLAAQGQISTHTGKRIQLKAAVPCLRVVARCGQTIDRLPRLVGLALRKVELAVTFSKEHNKRL